MVTIVDGKTWVNITELDHKPGVLPSKKLVTLTDQPVQSFPPPLTDIQLQILDLLGVPVKSFLG